MIDTTYASPLIIYPLVHHLELRANFLSHPESGGPQCTLKDIVISTYSYTHRHMSFMILDIFGNVWRLQQCGCCSLFASLPIAQLPSLSCPHVLILPTPLSY